MNYTGHVLSWATFFPAIGAALIVLLLGVRHLAGISKRLMDELSRYIALVTSAVSFAYAIVAWRAYDPATTMPGAVGS